MFFNNDEDDSDFLSPTGGSKLANLFGVDQTMSKGGNESLTYTAPKEPKKKKADDGQPGSSSANSPTLLHALAAQTYKFVDGKSVSQGKLGVALLGSHAEADYKILVYRTKQEQITHVSVTPSFKLSIHANNYASFYDDQRQGWSLMFDSEQALASFAKEVGLAVAGSAAGNIDNTLTQELVIGEGEALEVGDSAEVRYTGWLFRNNSLGDEYESNVNAEKLFRLKLGKGKTIKGWEDGMVGVKKGGKRLLIIPPSLGYGAKGNGTAVPPNSTLAIEFEIVRMKPAKDKDTASIADSVASNSSDVNVNPAANEENVKARTKSIDEQLNKGGASGDAKKDKPDKQRLISRMAKMGQAMLPGMNTTNAGGESDEEEDSQGSETAHSASQHASGGKPPVGAKPHPKPQAAHPMEPHHDLSQPMQQPAFDPMTGQPIMSGTHPWAPPVQMAQQHYAMSHSPLMASQPPSAAVFQGVPMPNQMALYQNAMQPGYHPHMYPQPPQYAATGAAPIPPVSTVSTIPADLPVLMSESRQQNTEIRLTLSRMSDKVDNIHSKIEGLHHNMGSVAPQMSAPSMETSVLLQNIQRIVSENEHLKKEVFERSARIEAQNEKINDLLQRNQKYVEQSNTMIEQRNDAYKTTATQSQHKVLTLEQERVHLASELSSATAQLGNLQLELNGSKKNEAELASQLDSAVTMSKRQLEELNSLRERLKVYEHQVEENSSSLKDEKILKKRAESELSNVREELNDLRISHEALEKNFNEKRQKYTRENKKLEEELEELKLQHESEVSSLKEKLRKQRTSTDVATAEQVSQLEKELEADWKEKCDRLLATANERHQRSLQELKEEKETLESKVANLENKMSQAKGAKVADEKVKQELQGQVDDLQVWKDKYEVLRKQAGEMKQRYEEKLAEVDEERELMEKQRDIAVQKAREAIAAAAAGGAGGGAGSSQDIAGEVKKIMNTVYKQLKAQFETSKTYPGDDIHKAILQTVKDVTLSMIPQQEAGAVKEEVMVTSSANLSAAPPSAKAGKPQDDPQKAQLLGDKGNPYYLEELKKTADQIEKVSSEKKQDVQSAIEGLIISSEAAITGDKGNVHYGEEISKGHKDDNSKSKDKSKDKSSDKSKDKDAPIKEEVMVVEGANLQSAGKGPPSKGKTDSETEKDKVNKDSVKSKESALKDIEASIMATTAGVTGDKGNVHYAEELKKAAEHKSSEAKQHSKDVQSAVEDLIMSSEASITGDKGNVHYGKELEKEAKPAGKEDKGKKDVKSEKMEKVDTSLHSTEPPLFVKEEVMTQSSAPQQSHGQAPPRGGASGGVEEKITAVTASITGDKGNVHYGEEIRKAGKDKSKDLTKSIEESIIPVTASVTGDKGNRYYAAEIQGKKIDEERKMPAKKPASDILGDIESSIISGASIISDDKASQKSKQKTTGAKKQDKTPEKAPAGSADILSGIESSIIQDYDFGSPTKKADPLSGSKVVTKDVTKASKAEPSSAKKQSAKAPSLFDEDDDKDLFGAEPFKKSDKKPDKKVSNKKVPSKKTNSDSEEDWKPKPPPPPLFGDDDEEDDLDWLSK